MSPQMARRVAALGFVAFALFAIVFFRLWYLQVLAGDRYLVEANQNRTRVIPVAAPRGDIVDRDGRPIVSSRLANVVQLNPQSLSQAERDAAATWGQEATSLAKAWLSDPRHTVRWRAKHSHATAPLPAMPPIPAALRPRFGAIGKVLTMRPAKIQKLVVRSLAAVPYAAITLRVDVPRSMLDFLEERKSQYPGVVPDTLFLRKYPRGELAAQLLGNVGEISPDQVKQARFRGVRTGIIVGKGGVELEYDHYLRGRDGARKLQVNASGQFVGEITRARRSPTAGSQIKLSLDLSLQRAGEDALRHAIAAANADGLPSRAGAFVAMNPASGEIYAMGSAPSFDPTEFTKPISDRRYKQLISDENGKPLFNRATQGLYPTGSTFKPFTALAALQRGAITPIFSVNDTGCIKVGEADRCNAGHPPAVYGTVDLRNALKVSSDVYFYTLGIRLDSPKTEIIQNMARDLGLGRPTGIDLPAEFAGTPPGNIPDWKWREQIAKTEAACRRKEGIPLGPDFSVYEAAARGCGISDMRTWSVGDNVNLAVGQGDVQASPLQMAVAYSSIAMDGRVPRPHLGLQVQDSAGRLVQRIEPGPARHITIDPDARAAVLDGLHAATTEAGGTSTGVWESWNQTRFPVDGKTGTAETIDHGSKYDQSWYVCWITNTSKPNDPGIVIAVTIEKGGFGAQTAAPAARLIASRFFHQRAQFIAGDNATR